MKKIILISGKAGAGKDSVANMLKDKLPGRKMVISFADYLKFFAQKYYNWNGIKDENGRRLLQKLGTDIIRSKNKTFHIDIVMSVIQTFEDEFDYFIIPDVRFKNEIHEPSCEYFEETTTCYVKRLNFKNNLTPEANSHISENELNNREFDYYIESESGLDHLEIEIDKYVKFLLGDK